MLSMPATMSRKRKLPLGWWTLIPAVALYGVLGCSPAPAPTVAVRPAVAHDDHDHDGHDGHDDHDHSHPKTLAAGLTELESMWGHVRAALAAGERDKADDKVIPIDARKLFGIKKGSDVVIRGQGAFDPKLAIPVIQVTAEAIHVRQAAP